VEGEGDGVGDGVIESKVGGMRAMGVARKGRGRDA